MMELPEARVLAKQLAATVGGKTIAGVVAAHTPHKLAWYYGDRTEYRRLLVGRCVGRVEACGGLVEIEAEGVVILLGEGTAVRFHPAGEPRPDRHQMLVDFEDGSAVSAAVQMYGGMGAFRSGELDNPYYRAAKDKPSPFSAAFNAAYFERLVSADEARGLSLKGLLATQQRIPGLGNGVLQDILFNAKCHPRRKVGSLAARDRRVLFTNVKKTLADMADKGGRRSELDLFGKRGGYDTILSKDSVDRPCPACGAPIRKESYMGGSVYYCPHCQAA